MSNWLKNIRPGALALLVSLVFALVACANKPKLSYHTFSFDVLSDSPDAELLDYRYGTSKQPGARPPEWALKEGKIRQQAGINGEMVVGETLYVKWRIKSTKEIFESTVDLARRLPADMTNRTVYFVIDGKDISVYLIEPDFRPANFPIAGPKKYRDFKTYSIYPTSTFKN